MALNESAQRSISPLLAIAAIVIVIAGIKAAEDIVCLLYTSDAADE